MPCNRNSLLDMRRLHLAALSKGKRLCEADGGLDLPAVELVGAELLDIEVFNARSREEVRPHLLALRAVEVGVAERDADTYIHTETLLVPV